MTTAGSVAGSLRRTVAAVVAPITDTFSGAFDTTKWAGTSYGVSNVSGRLRIPCSNSYPQAQTAKVFNLNAGYPISIQLPTVQAPGNGGTQSRMRITDGTNEATFSLQNAPLSWSLVGTGIGATSLAYSSTNHQWMRFNVVGGNLLWQFSPDNVTWTTAKTVAAPAWISSVSVILDSNYYGTETAPGFAEFDNFNV